jgi:hypothetical protein
MQLPDQCTLGRHLRAIGLLEAGVACARSVSPPEGYELKRDENAEVRASALSRRILPVMASRPSVVHHNDNYFSSNSTIWPSLVPVLLKECVTGTFTQ